MATVKISELPAILGANTATTDVLPLVDVSLNTTNKITRAEFFKNVPDMEINDKIIHSGDTNTAIRFPAADTVTVETAGTERLRITDIGRVGLGVTNPALRFQVAALSSSTSTVIAATEVDYLANFRSSQLGYHPVDTTGTTLGFSNSNLGSLSFLNCTNAVIGTNGATPLAFATTNTERMRITSTGNVGIGTTSPGQALSVNGNIDILGSTTETRQLQIGFGRTGDGISLIDFISDATYTDFGMRISRSAGENGVAFINVRGTGGLDIRTTDAAPIYFVTNATERMRITSTGNVGIGNTAPITPLHVTGATVTTGVVYKNQPAQSVESAAATLTIAELLTGIIQYTGALATLTMPTGTDIEGGVPATFPTNMSFDFSVINTGSGVVTLGTATGLTLVGGMTVAVGASGLFRVRKTAANTYTVYRIS